MDKEYASHEYSETSLITSLSGTSSAQIERFIAVGGSDGRTYGMRLGCMSR